MKAPPRREFLLRVLAACGTPLVAFVSSVRADQRPPLKPGTDARAAASYFGTGIAAARAIGEAYLRRQNAEPTQASIIEHSAGALRILAAARTETTALTELASAVRRDFRDGRVLELEGWVLSRTEVELCTLTLLPGSM
jgi:hypothetical protein